MDMDPNDDNYLINQENLINQFGDDFDNYEDFDYMYDEVDDDNLMEDCKYEYSYNTIDGQIQYNDYDGICLNKHNNETNPMIRRKCVKCNQINYKMYIVFYNEGRYMKMNDINMKVVRAVDRESRNVCNYGIAIIDDVKFNEKMISIIKEIEHRNEFAEFMGPPTINYKHEYEGHLFRFVHNKSIPKDLNKYSKRDILYTIYKIYIKRYDQKKILNITIKGKIRLISDV